MFILEEAQSLKAILNEHFVQRLKLTASKQEFLNNIHDSFYNLFAQVRKFDMLLTNEENIFIDAFYPTNKNISSVKILHDIKLCSANIDGQTLELIVCSEKYRVIENTLSILRPKLNSIQTFSVDILKSEGGRHKTQKGGVKTVPSLKQLFAKASKVKTRQQPVASAPKLPQQTTTQTRFAAAQSELVKAVKKQLEQQQQQKKLEKQTARFKTKPQTGPSVPPVPPFVPSQTSSSVTYVDVLIVQIQMLHYVYSKRANIILDEEFQDDDDENTKLYDIYAGFFNNKEVDYVINNLIKYSSV